MACSIVVVLHLLTLPVLQVASADPVLIENVPKMGWRARELKAAKQYAEAVKARQAALAQDPDHIDAHWILAWVRIGLGDKDEAAAAFRRVIELSPGTELAQEAQGALERLGR